MHDRRWIGNAAHRLARANHGLVIRGVLQTYRIALVHGFRKAWATAKDIAAIVARDAAMSAEARARRDKAIIIQCSTDGPLTAADHDRLRQLARVRQHRPRLLPTAR